MNRPAFEAAITLALLRGSAKTRPPHLTAAQANERARQVAEALPALFREP